MRAVAQALSLGLAAEVCWHGVSLQPVRSMVAWMSVALRGSNDELQSTAPQWSLVLLTSVFRSSGGHRG